jgi:hypothetical protein
MAFAINVYERQLRPDQIRLLSLDRGFSQPAGWLCCDMQVVSLTESDVHYDTLSYAWGDSSHREKHLLCNGLPVAITDSLSAALRHIWSKWPTKTIWVDALCINQADVFERNQQVTMMGRIYKRAENVVVWLGDEGEDAVLWPGSGGENSAHTWPWIEHERWNFQDDNQLPLPGQFIGGKRKYRAGIGSSVPLDLNLLQRASAEQASRASLKATATEIMKFLAYKEALTYMLSRPWFHRAWTFQEIAVAQNAVICCGAYDVQFAVFSRALKQLDSLLSRFPGGALNRLNQLVLHDIVRSREEKSLFGLLIRTNHRQASDPRDKLFSIIGLLPPDLYGFMQADYSLSIKETFIWAARVCIELDNDLNCLSAAGRANQRDDSLPSWVPDWRQTHIYERLESFRQTSEQSEMTC